MSLADYRETIFKQIGYEPTEAQKPVHESDAKVKLVAGGWRGGKSVTGSKEAALLAPRATLGWLVGATYEIPRNNEFKFIMEDMQKLSLLTKNVSYPERGPCKMTLYNGCQIVTKSANDPTQLGMDAPDFIIICEAAQLDYETYLWLKGRCLEKNAPMIMTGTFEDFMGWYNDFFTLGQMPNEEGIESFSLPTWANTKVFEPGDNEITLTNGQIVKNINDAIFNYWETTPADFFLQRYGAIPCKPSNLILPEFSNRIHVGKFPYDPTFPVEIAVDPGSGVPGAYAIEAIQVKEGITYIVAEKYLQGYITEDIITACKKDWPWFNKIERGVIDIAAKQKHGMPPVVKAWQDEGIWLDSKYIEVEDGIEKLRTALKVHPETGRANLYVDHSCRGFISECGGCPSPAHGGGVWLRNKDTGREVDANNHATKAVAYYHVVRWGFARRKESTYGQVFRPDQYRRMIPVGR